MSEKVLLIGNISSLAETLFSEAGFDIQRIEDAGDTRAISSALSTADAVCGRTSMKLSAEMIENAPQLKAIAVFSVNTSGVNVNAATERQIPVFSAAGLNATSVVELTIGLMLSILRKIPQQDARLKTGIWQKSANKDNAREASGKILGIVGFGDIGQKVARIAAALDMQIVFFDPFVEKSPNRDFKKVSKENLLKNSDIVTVHAATDEELIGEDDIALMRSEAYILNMARKTTVNANAIAAALKAGKLAGAAIDVHESEKNPFESVLADEEIKDKIVLTNHSGGETLEVRERISKKVSQKVIDHLKK